MSLVTFLKWFFIILGHFFCKPIFLSQAKLLENFHKIAFKLRILAKFGVINAYIFWRIELFYKYSLNEYYSLEMFFILTQINFALVYVSFVYWIGEISSFRCDGNSFYSSTDFYLNTIYKILVYN